MGIFTAIFGHTKLQAPSREEFFSIVGAAHDLESRTDLRPTQKAGLVVNPVESSYFDNLDAELRTLLDLSGRATGTRFEITDDEFGTRWIILDDPDFEDLVSLIHTTAETIIEHGFADRLLAAAFLVEYQGRPAYWLYNYKLGRFYPFVPTASRQRDNAAEMRLGEIMRQEKIPVARRLEQWYALWGIPFLPPLSNYRIRSRSSFARPQMLQTWANESPFLPFATRG